MEVLKIKKGQTIARRKEKVMQWYLVQEGSVIQKLDFAEVSLGRNTIVGILESDWFICDYIAREDSVLLVIPCKNADDLKKILAANERYRGIFLRTAIEQRHRMFALYSELSVRTKQFHAFVQTVYHDYKSLCSSNNLDEQAFPQMDYFNMIEMKHKAQTWEILNSVSLVKNYLKEYIQFMGRDDSLSVGVIMEASAQMHRAMLGVREMVKYLTYQKEILLTEAGNDMFSLYFDLAVRASRRQLDLAPIQKEITILSGFIQKMNIYDRDLIHTRVKQYEDYDFTHTSSASITTGMDVVSEDCLGRILEFSRMPQEDVKHFKDMIEAYKNLPDMMSSDTDAYKLRKQIAASFYDVYYHVFLEALQNEDEVSPIIEMFLNFGFMDVQIAGEEHTKALYDLTGRLRQFQSDHIFTIYDWLKHIYKGEKEPSKNEFDLDYIGALLERRKNGDLTDEQVKQMQNDQKEKVRFEIQNMFTSANRITSGRISTFCPVLYEMDLINSVGKMAVTVEKLEEALNKTRIIDYSVFYREIQFPGQGLDILNHEPLMIEVLPDIILMPNAGTRCMMWQETADKRRDTPARFLFPIFTAADLDDMMIETIGRFRWEMCRKIQGVRWNDIREKSLTSEYCDYLQFYRKNQNLSVDAKDKLKLAITRAKNNYREVFAKDYENWIKYESKGSFRLNKVARDILIQYCPFTEEIRQDLKSNPVYQNAFAKLERENVKKVQRLTALYDKYEKAGGEVTAQMEDNLAFYQM